MALNSHYRYELTGTPISNGQLENIWSQFAFLEPEKGNRGQIRSKIFDGSYYDWLGRYAYLNQWHQPYKYRNVDELQTIIDNHSYRVTKAECLDLPEKLPDDIWNIELGDKKHYRQLIKDSAIEEFDIIAENSLSRMSKLRQLCSGFIKTEDGTKEVPCEKLTALEDFLDGYGQKPLVIFCEFHHSIDAISNLLHERKISYGVLDGRTKDKDIWKKFQNGDIRILVCQYQSANAGIDLFRSDTILYFEPTLSSNVLEQSRDRIHRIGQHHPCSYVHFITKGIESEIYQALSNYKDFTEKLFTEYMTDYAKGMKM